MITIVIAADTQLLRELLRTALDGRSGISVVATAPDHLRALALIQNLQADVAIISLGLPESNLLIRGLAGKPVRVVTLRGPCEGGSVAVVDDGTVNDIIAAVHGAMHGAFATTTRLLSDLDQLTHAERVVLEAVNDGLCNKEIAQRLGVAVPTVKHHVHSLLTKLGVRRRGEAAAIYRRSSNAAGLHAPVWLTSTSRSRSLRQT